jgi:uncharacterized protein (DUF2235 family)
VSKNVVLCFAHVRQQPGTGGDDNATELFRLLAESDDQICWFDACTPRRVQRRDALATTRVTVSEAYAFVARNFEPGDRVLVFGAGHGGYCAQALTRLLGTVGILAPRWDDLVDYVVAAYGLPRTRRTPQEWARVNRLAAELNDGHEPTVPVAYLGIWDGLRAPALPTPPSVPVSNVVAGRHAMAVDGGPFGHRLVSVPSDRVDAVWFRGAHCDVAGGAGACEPLTGIALDWVLDGALAAGASLQTDHAAMSTPASQDHALAGSARALPLRRLPTGAHVHASVDVYLRAHPEYWRRLPDRIVWSDRDWLARGERLVPAAVAPAVAQPDLMAVAS